MRDLRFFPQHLRDGDTNADFARKINQLYQLQEELPTILEQLHLFKPLCHSGNQHQLARNALSAIQNRNLEDIRKLAKNLANDVADTVD